MRVAPPPEFSALVEGLAGDRLLTLLRSGVGEDADEYIHWDKLRHLEPPADLSHEEWWLLIKLGRQRLFRQIPLTDATGRCFAYCIPDVVFRGLHYVDQRCSGEIAMPEVVTADQQARQHYLVNSLMEEAIRSSQLEGATTSRRVAKDLLRSGREPKDRSERMIFNMTEDEWDDVVRAHLKGHFVPTRWAAAWWRAQAKAGREVRASVVCTTSTSGLIGTPGQANYGAAKAGIAAFTVIAAQELGRYGVRVNAIAPLARTRLTTSTPGLAAMVMAPADPAIFDTWHPANVSPVVAWLAAADCPVTGRVFLAHGGKVELFRPWSLEAAVDKDGRWSAAELAEALHLP